MLVINVPPWQAADTNDPLGRTHRGYRQGMNDIELYHANMGDYVIGEDRLREPFALFAVRQEDYLVRAAVKIHEIGLVREIPDAPGEHRDHRRAIYGSPLSAGHPVYDSYVGKPSPLGKRHNPVGYYDSPLDLTEPCQCGCGEMVKGNPFKRGHDQTALHNRVSQIGTVVEFIAWFDSLRKPFPPAA